MRKLAILSMAMVIAFGAAFAAVGPATAHDRASYGVSSGQAAAYGPSAVETYGHSDRGDYDRHVDRDHQSDRHDDFRRDDRGAMHGGDFRGADRGQDRR